MMAQSTDFAVSGELLRDLRVWRSRAAIVGVAALAVTAIGAIAWPAQFFRSYLWSYVFYLGVTLGSMAWLMLQYLSGGAWGMVIRRPCEAATRTLPLLAILFVPVGLGISSLYRWSHADVVAADAIIRHKHAYLNVPFFLARAALYFAGWLVCSWYLNRWSSREDREGPAVVHRKLATWAGPGLIFWAFSITFMAVDWVLSLDPHWFSTIFGMLFMAGQGLSSMAFLITLMVLLSYRRPMSDVLTPRHLHDLGKLLLALVMVWAYFSFSQFLIIWSGNLPSEIPWYLERLRGGWQYVGLALVLGHFALPFALLLSRDLKRDFKLLAGIAIFILFMRYVDLYWLVAPDFLKGSLGVSWMDFTAPAGLGGIWLAYFLLQLEMLPLMPLRDPHLEEALQHGRE
ncbi:MAG: hypothetical protein LAP87_01000 [Acidobacteriia bacterium]|nr:hypothetical protein [Terriglobia bacterium]